MSLGSFDRRAALRDLADGSFDVLVVGGGITGAGVALDAASRGLRTALVERDDFASGTSSKSSKMIHGGLRYLQNGDVRLVYEALRERQRLLHNAPHLVRVLPFLIPIYSRDGVISRKLARALGSAMWMYDATGGARIGKLHKRLSAAETLERMPTLPSDRVAGGYLYFDARADDARLTMTIARTAAIDHGAVVVNGARVTAIGGGDNAGATASVVTVEADGNEFDVRARVVVNATGVWADRVQRLDGGDDATPLRPAKGIHIVVPWRKVRAEVAVVVPVPKDKRSIFVVPWGDLAYIGTTDTDYDGPIDDPVCTPDDIRYLLDAMNFSLREPLGADDVLGTWAGLRPLVSDVSDGRTADLSRRHVVSVGASGMITVTGGKLTTYREMASDAVDAALEQFDENHRKRRSRTKRLRLRGAAGHETVAASHPPEGTGSETLAHLAGRYGGDARVVLAMIEGDRSLADPIVEGLPYVMAEARYAVRYEMARSLDDVLARRTRIRLLARDASADCARRVADLVAPDLGWSTKDAAAAVTEYRSSVTAEREAAGLPETALDAAIGA